MFSFRPMIPVLGLVALAFFGPHAMSQTTGSTISHTGSVAPGSKVMVNGSFTWATGYSPTVTVDFGNYSGGTFSSFNLPVLREATVAVVTPPTGTFSINPPYPGTAGVQVAFRSTLYTRNFLGFKTNIANTVGTITP